MSRVINNQNDPRIVTTYENRETNIEWAFEDYAEQNKLEVPKDTTARIMLKDDKNAHAFVDKKMNRFDAMCRVQHQRGSSAFSQLTSNAFINDAKTGKPNARRKEIADKLESAQSLTLKVNELCEELQVGVISVARNTTAKPVLKVAKFKLAGDLSNQSVIPTKKG